MTNNPQRPEQGQPDEPTRGTRGVRAERPAGRSAGRNPARLGILAGLLGLVALGGVTAGLVASNAATTPSTPHVPPHSATSPSPSPTGHRLAEFTGSASGASHPFVVPSSPVTAHYSYTCPASLASVRHGFAAQLENASGTDIQPIAASTNMSKHGTVTLHPRDVGSPYHVVTTTNCPFKVKVSTK